MKTAHFGDFSDQEEQDKILNTIAVQHAITEKQLAENAPVQAWVGWFYEDFLPGWIERTRDPNGFGFYDLLDEHAQPLQKNRRTLLAQARLLFTFSHLALTSGNEAFREAAVVAKDALPAFLKAPGCYSRARNANKQPTDNAEDNLAMSYDQTFVILGLSTWGKLNPTDNVQHELEACWSAIETHLTDLKTGLLLEHDNLAEPTNPNAPPRAQNPHMHLYEAALQAYEMTEDSVWLERAMQMRSKGIEFFYDQSTGSIIEFIAPDLSSLNNVTGQRREIGHQCEWAWLLYREAELDGDANVRDIADTLLAFADKHGYAQNGAMKGAAYDAVAFDQSWYENQFLLWPQTEAIKTYAIKKHLPDGADKGRHLMQLVFQKYFANQAAFVNQVDNNGIPVWSEALSRLLYHLVLALTEGDRAGLWETP